MLATLPTTEASTQLSDPLAEVREWEYAEEAQDMPRSGTTTSQSSDARVMDLQLQLDGRVRQLVEADYDDGPETLMGDLQAALRNGDRRIASQLATVASSPCHGADARSLALETLTAARAKPFESLAAEAVRVALEEPSPRMQFAGIAAVGDLSRSNQVLLSRVVRELIAAPAASEAVKRAGAAFLRRRV